MLHHLRTWLPREDLLYCADSRYAPYGNKSRALILERSRALAGFLLHQGAKAIVVACNTATAASASVLRKEFNLPIIAMEPAVKPAVAATRSGVIGVLATVGTLQSAQFAALLEQHGQAARVVTQACHGLVECVERGDMDGPATRDLVRAYVEPLLAQGADTLVLGCTHYPFLAPVVQEIAGPEVALIETGAAVARQLQRCLAEQGLLRDSGCGGERFWTSGDPAQARRVMGRLWGREVAVAALG